MRHKSTLPTVLMICCLMILSMAADKPATAPSPRLQFRLVLEAGDAGDADEVADSTPNGKPLRLAKGTALDERDLQEVAKRAGREQDREISMTFTDAGAEKLRAFTRDHIGKRVAIVFDGKVLSAPRVNSEIGKEAVITGGGKDGFTEKEQADLVKSIDEAIKASRK
jgi:preprotein translocase subunit SecD